MWNGSVYVGLEKVVIFFWVVFNCLINGYCLLVMSSLVKLWVVEMLCIDNLVGLIKCVLFILSDFVFVFIVLIKVL